MTDTTTLWELCEHGHCQAHPLEKMRGSAGPTMLCRGGRERTFRQSACDSCCPQNPYVVFVEVDDE